jgi:PAS domain S-box-containing protein
MHETRSVDVDERKNAEDRLRRSEAYLAEAERLSHTSSAAYNETELLHWSEESSRLFGFDPLQGIPSREAVWQRIHPDDLDRVNETIERGVREKRSFANEFRIIQLNGTTRHVEAINHPVFSASGELLEILTTGIDVTERKRAEQALRESEAKFRDYAETASDWFWEIGPDYKFTLLTENAFGALAADRLGTACWDHAIDLETEPEKWRLMLATLDSRKPFRDFVYRGLSGNDSPMYVRASGKPVFDANGEFRGYRGTGTDVTALMCAQEALRESERSSRSALDGIPGLVAVLAPNGELEAVNRPLFEYFGRSLEWLKNWGTNDAVHPEDLPRVVEIFRRAVASGLPFQFDQRQRCIDGEYRWFNNRGVPIRDDSGRIARWYVLMTDIEDRKHAEEALRSALDGIAGLVSIMAPNGELETVNRQVVEYFGRSLEELKNWGTSDAVHPEELPRVLELFKKGMASGIPFSIEQRMRRFDGEYRWFDTRLVPIRDDSGRIARWYILATDIEDRSRALARLEQMQSDFAHMNRVATMGQLTASITHEVNQPITAAVTYALAARRFLSADPPNFREIDDALSLIVKEGNRAGEVVERVRALVKKVPARKDAVEIDDAILKVIALTRSEAANNSVSVRTQFAEGLPPVQGDRVQLQQVMLNLIVNAIHSMSGVEDGNRELHISTVSIEPDGVCVGVRDTGPGLSPESLSRLFEPFYTTKPEGMGMGLSICRTIIEAHGGRLWAIPCEPQGALFQFSIPAARADGS